MKHSIAALAMVFGLGLGCAPARAAPDAAAGPKVLRYAFRVAETGFDPLKVTDIYSRTINGHIFEGLYTYDQLARPAKLIPLTAVDMPEVSEDFKTWTIRIRPGIYFADDPAFGGKQRELVANDYVYVFKRSADPAVASPLWGEIEEQGVIGLADYHQQLRKSGRPFDYDREIEGLRALDRYTLQFRLSKPRPRFLQAQTDLYGAVAREVIEAYAGKTMEHPVGTGPFMLKSWRRSSQIVLERNPNYRERYYEAQPAADDAEGQAVLAKLRGRRLPLVDRVEISIIEENQPRWLSFIGGEFDFIERVPDDFLNQAMPLGKLAPHLAKRGIQGYRNLGADIMYWVFNMEDPLVGGYTPDKVALRRAIGLASNVPREIQLARRGQAIPAQSMYMPHGTGYDPEFKSEMSDYDPARAKALLDMYGYLDRDGDGWREQPDGSPLLLESLTTPDGLQRQVDEIWQKSLAQVGLRVSFKTAKWPENFKALRAGKFQIWGLANSAAMPDAQDSLTSLHSGHIGESNFARFRNEAADRLYDRAGALPDGPEREALFRESKRIVAAYMPYKYKGHRLHTDLAQPQLIGYRRHPFKQHWWEMVEIDNKLGRAGAAQ
jgi:ABC-type transport system substrate-binding protein